MFQKRKPLQLRKAALFFLRLIADEWFNTPSSAMDGDGMNGEMEGLCVGWASAVDEFWGTDGVREAALAVLLDMINSSQWRPHVVPDKWKLLEQFDSVPDNSQPLTRCLKNPDLVDAVSTVGNPEPMVLWLKILLLKYNRLDRAVQGRLEASMRGNQRKRVDEYLSVMQLELRGAEEESSKYGTWSTDSKATALEEKIESHEAAIGFLESVKKS